MRKKYQINCIALITDFSKSLQFGLNCPFLVGIVIVTIHAFHKWGHSGSVLSHGCINVYVLIYFLLGIGQSLYCIVVGFQSHVSWLLKTAMTCWFFNSGQRTLSFVFPFLRQFTFLLIDVRIISKLHAFLIALYFMVMWGFSLNSVMMKIPFLT